MKKNIAMRVASLVLMCTIVTSCFVSSTFAKYTSSVSGKDSVTVAKWEIVVENQTLTTSTPAETTFDLFSTTTTYEEDGKTVDPDVLQGRIAPGTGGAFSVDITNKSEVDATYKVDFALYSDEACTKSLSYNPFQFSADGTSYGAEIPEGTATEIAMNGTTPVSPTIYWKWPYDGDDTKDTSFNGSDVWVKAIITVEQVN